MKIFEIILKVAFLVDAIYLYAAKFINPSYFSTFIIICVLLGVVLIFNKKQSYGYMLAKKEIVMRRIEGIALIIFAVAMVFVNVS